MVVTLAVLLLVFGSKMVAGSVAVALLVKLPLDGAVALTE